MFYKVLNKFIHFIQGYAQLAFACLNSTIETLEKNVQYVQS